MKLGIIHNDIFRTGDSISARCRIMRSFSTSSIPFADTGGRDEDGADHGSGLTFRLGNGGAGRAGATAMIGAALLTQHAAHFGNAFAALRPIGQVTIDRSYRMAPAGNRTANVAVGKAMTETDIHRRRPLDESRAPALPAHIRLQTCVRAGTDSASKSQERF